MGLIEVRLLFRINEVHADMVFDDFGHKAIHRAARACKKLERVAATDLTFKCSLDRFNLASNAAHPTEKFRFFSRDMGHGLGS